MNPLRRLAAGLALALALWGLAVSSGVAVAWHAEDAAALRLSWSVRPERVERCRTLSEQEQAQRPAHMRQSVVCEGSSASYALTVGIDEVSRDSARLRGSGLRGDRALATLRDYPVAPGAHRVQVRFERIEPVDSAVARSTAVPPLLQFDSTLTFRTGAVLLLTIEDGRFALRNGSGGVDARPGVPR
ncbi:MAG: hypothetical protein KF709_09800 [Gemmatimonadaceae bacterium]|nr:hypothetical protein [Gemmatimonadaceae bacterium]